MKKQRKSILVLAFMVVFVAAGLFLPGLIGAGDLEPSAAPGPTMKTLDQIPPTWSQILPAAERFELVMGDAAVLDKETGLVWEREPDLSTRNWHNSVVYCYQLEIGGRMGWRPPTVEELTSLIDTTQVTEPYLPNGHPFIVPSNGGRWWSATTRTSDTTAAYRVNFSVKVADTIGKDALDRVWCVRCGHGYDGYY